MRWFVFVALAACSKEPPAKAPLIAQSRALADRMCGCKDATCASSVDKEWNALLKDAKLDADDVDAIAAETQRYTKCLAAVPK